jgi:uncharacterized protein YyaL (SSP411 family)
MVLSPKKQKSDYYNHLKNEKSPYLQQHLHNPVDWYPWGDEAFQKARTEDKPIFLSIGYSTCHWCHVMARESFQDQEIARLLNEVFVAVKVDREERPDIDSVYMTVCQIMTGSGGWPLTILLTPDLKPFFAGTYFPKEGHGESVGLKDLILNVKELWQEQRNEVINSAKDIITALQETSQTKSGDQLGDEILHKTYEALRNSFDQEYAGFGGFQKFPTPHHLFFLLRYWKRTANEQAMKMVEKTLTAMQQGGIYDQLGYGFHRYSVDPQWLVPHFEKMLYDQALLAVAYTEAYQATRKNNYRETAEQTIEYLLRDMQSLEGAFYSAEDADSEGVEGKFYLWTREEILKVLGEEEGELFCQVYQVKDEGNFAEQATGRKTDRNILHLKGSLKESALELEIETTELIHKLKQSHDKLFQWREKRVRPQRDDKVLSDWNGLVIVALSYASLVFKRAEYADKAREAADFILSHMCHHNRLWHRWRDGEPAVDGNLDDYAYLIWGLLELYQTTFKTDYLETALKLNQTLTDHFWDGEVGGYFFTADDTEKVLLREKSSYDTALPSGNSVQMLNLMRLSLITGKAELEEKAIELERSFSPSIELTPLAHTMFLSGTDLRMGPAFIVVIAGQEGRDGTEVLINTLKNEFTPNIILVLKDEHDDRLEEIMDLQEKEMLDGKATAYVCGGGTCYAPVTEPAHLGEILGLKKFS